MEMLGHEGVVPDSQLVKYNALFKGHIFLKLEALTKLEVKDWEEGG
jgi:hypothetical protein